MKSFVAICFSVFVGLLSFVMVPAQEVPKEIKGGILNGKATTLPVPDYPSEARAAGVEATVTVDVVVDESGTVISAVPGEVSKINSGNDLEESVAPPIEQLLRQSAEKAALSSRFAPTMLSGVPIKVSGILVFTFAASSSPFPVSDWGIMNGKASNLPKPVYPDAAKAARVGGTVIVRVVIDENGGVISAAAISGHPLLRSVSVEAAKAAKFAPTMLSGRPVKVSGMLTYNFTAPKKDKETN